MFVEIFPVTLIGIGLAMDCFAVSITSGIAIKNLRINNALQIALFFGSFQAFMPVIGWFAGLGLRDFITGVDHWVAFGLLSLIGLKMIYESTKLKSDKKEMNPLNIYVLSMLSIATSIDALAIGVSFAFLKISLVTSIIIIGAITFVLSFVGVFVGNRTGHFFENKIELAGGLILIGIGTKILIEHLV
jgi:putative Mn2+ efflux pump MntP